MPKKKSSSYDPDKSIQVYFSLKCSENDLGRIDMLLNYPEVPKAVDNFVSILTDVVGKSKSSGKVLKYDGCVVFRKENYAVFMGDCVGQDGSGSDSKYGEYFESERLDLMAFERGTVGMCNKGVDKNGCSFFVCLEDCDWLNGKYQPIGKVLNGIEILDRVKERKDMEVIMHECGVAEDS